MKKTYRFLRVLEYVGTREWIDRQIDSRQVKGTRVCNRPDNCMIREAIIGDTAELFEVCEQAMKDETKQEETE